MYPRLLVGSRRAGERGAALRPDSEGPGVVGVFGEKPVVDLGLVQDRELCLVGTLMYQKPDFERSIELVHSGNMHLDELITHRFAFENYLDAYQAIEESRGQYMKVMIELD